jgi:hypothetical protein
MFGVINAAAPENVWNTLLLQQRKGFNYFKTTQSQLNYTTGVCAVSCRERGGRSRSKTHFFFSSSCFPVPFIIIP